MPPARSLVLLCTLGLFVGSVHLALARSRRNQPPPPPAEPDATSAVPTEPVVTEPAPAAFSTVRPPSWNADVVLQPGYSQPVLTLDEATLDALYRHQWAKADPVIAGLDRTKMDARTQADQAFLLAWMRVRSGRDAEALPFLDTLAQAPDAPPAYIALTQAEILLADGRYVEAATLLESVPETQAVIWPRARVLLSEAWFKAGRTADARAVLQALVDRPDPAPGGAKALLAMARKAGDGSDDAYRLLRRIWCSYPTSFEYAAAEKMLASYEVRGGRYKPTLAEKAARADAWMNANRYDKAIEAIKPALTPEARPSPEACVAWLALGRSQYMKNDLTAAATVLEPAATACRELDPDRGARSLFLAAKARERKKLWAEAALLYEKVPDWFPTNSLADDGYVNAGIMWQEAEDLPRAKQAWTRQAEAYPDGDMAAEAHWRLAWAAWREGDTRSALAWVDRTLASVPLETDAVRVRGAAYWRARWMLWPDALDPARVTTDPAVRSEGILRLLTVCREHPSSSYALLAAARLQALDPAALQAVPHPHWGTNPGPWKVRQSFLDRPATRNAMGLARLGLLDDAMDELATLGDDTLAPGEMGAVVDLLMRTGQWLQAHERLRLYNADVPHEHLDENRARLLTMTYPLRYESEVRAAVEPWHFDPLLFLALVREESSFNASIASPAGARGLSQLMPATARIVCKWLQIPYSAGKLVDPAWNTRVGARYFAFLLDRYKGNPFLSLAGYNAGEGNVDRWLREKGNLPVDEWAEAIPFRETRNYVKRVSSTWQTYHVLYGDDPLYPDLQYYNERAVPDSVPPERLPTLPPTPSK